MAKIIYLQEHARTSSKGWRAAKVVRVSAVRPAAVARSVARTSIHQSAGTLLRCHHLETTQDRTPISAAMASLEGHSSMISRKELILTIPNPLGHSVLKSKAVLSLDSDLPLGHNVRMAKKILTDFECRFLARTYAARKLKYDTQEEMAPALQDGMKQDTYKQYESRGPIPYELVDRFLRLTGVSYEWLFTGRGVGPAWQDRYEILLSKQQKAKRPRKSA